MSEMNIDLCLENKSCIECSNFEGCEDKDNQFLDIKKLFYKFHNLDLDTKLKEDQIYELFQMSEIFNAYLSANFDIELASNLIILNYEKEKMKDIQDLYTIHRRLSFKVEEPTIEEKGNRKTLDNN